MTDGPRSGSRRDEARRAGHLGRPPGSALLVEQELASSPSSWLVARGARWLDASYPLARNVHDTGSWSSR